MYNNSDAKISELAREKKNEYYRKWRRENKEKVAEYNRRYWEKKAEEEKELNTRGNS